MTAPPADGEHVLVLAPKERVRRPRKIAAFNQLDPTMWWVIRRAVARAGWSPSVASVAMSRPLGPDIRVLTPADEGITWCRGWSRESRDALAAAWLLSRGMT